MRLEQLEGVTITRAEIGTGPDEVRWILIEGAGVSLEVRDYPDNSRKVSITTPDGWADFGEASPAMKRAMKTCQAIKEEIEREDLEAWITRQEVRGTKIYCSPTTWINTERCGIYHHEEGQADDYMEELDTDLCSKLLKMTHKGGGNNGN